MSHTRWPARASTASQQRTGDTASVSRSRCGQAAVQRSSFHRLVSASLATATRYPARVGSTRVRIGLVILPTDRWGEARRQWEWADGAGFHTAWTYDHIRWGGMPDGPWHAAVPVLAAAAAVTERVRLGTLVATPNFRHPVTLAREAIALDDLSEGRLDLGLGPGSEGFDATALGQEPWTPAERLARFEEFLEVLKPIVDGEPADAHVAADGALRRRRGAQHARARCSARSPSPSPPAEPKGLRLAADLRAPLGDHRPDGARSNAARPRRCSRRCGARSSALDAACATAGREPSGIGKVLLWTPTEPVIDSADQFDELCSGPYAELGFDQFVLHHPAQTGPYGGDVGDVRADRGEARPGLTTEEPRPKFDDRSLLRWRRVSTDRRRAPTRPAALRRHRCRRRVAPPGGMRRLADQPHGTRS